MSIKPTDYVVNLNRLPSPSPEEWPVFWAKFQKHIEKDIDWRNPRIHFDRVGEAIRAYLKTIDAKMIISKKNSGIILKFKSEADFLIFKLKWS
jgi:hypothetical protein